MADQKYNIGCNTGSLGTATFVVFLVLKLCHVIDWSWWWVTAPIWISAIVWVLAIILIAFIYAIVSTK